MDIYYYMFNMFNMFNIFNEFLEEIYPQLRDDYYTDAKADLIDVDI